MDSKLVELIGRNYLTAELLKAGLEVATPVRDRGIDLITYVDAGDGVDKFHARPIQLKATMGKAFGIDKKYAKFPDLLIAHVWGLQDLNSCECYVMSQSEAVAIGDAMGWTATESWAKGSYVTTKPSKKLLELLAPFRVTSGTLREKILKPAVPVQPRAVSLDESQQAALDALLMVYELQVRGYERLRIVPGMSASGMHWRVTILPRTRVLKSHGAMSHDWKWGGPDPFYTTGDGRRFFGWNDAAGDTPTQLAEKFIERFPAIAKAGVGGDQAYLDWYVEMLSKARFGEFPVAYADWYEEPDPRWLPTTKGFDSGLRMPPPGDADESVADLPT